MIRAKYFFLWMWPHFLLKLNLEDRTETTTRSSAAKKTAKTVHDKRRRNKNALIYYENVRKVIIYPFDKTFHVTRTINSNKTDPTCYQTFSSHHFLNN